MPKDFGKIRDQRSRNTFSADMPCFSINILASKTRRTETYFANGQKRIQQYD
jgi:hypothetical protein